MEIVKINVGGTFFEINRNDLLKFPETRLGSLCTKLETETIFFSRNPEMFNNILDLYRLGTLHLPSGTCGATIHNEIEFWQLPLERLCDCCVREYFKYKRDAALLETLRKSFDDSDIRYDPQELERSRVKQVMNSVWLFIDQPKSSMHAKVFSVVFLLIVILSITATILETNEELRDPNPKLNQTILLWLVKYSTIRFYNELNLDNPKEVLMVSTEANDSLHEIHFLCTLFFIVEFVLHFITCPRKLLFFTRPLNVLDAILVSIMITTYTMEEYMEDIIEEYHAMNFYIFMKALLVLRVFRLFRFMKIFSGFRILIISIRSSCKELLLLFLSFVVASVLFATFIYYAEFKTPHIYENIQVGIWWSIITMTTVGYGDLYPKSALGYVVGTLCAFCGLLILALPIAVVASKFNDFYTANRVREERKELQENQCKKGQWSICKVAPTDVNFQKTTIT